MLRKQLQSDAARPGWPATCVAEKAGHALGGEGQSGKVMGFGIAGKDGTGPHNLWTSTTLQRADAQTKDEHLR